MVLIQNGGEFHDAHSIGIREKKKFSPGELKPVHQLLNQLPRVVHRRFGKAGINDGGIGVGVSQVFLYQPEVDPGFHQMSGVTVPESMDGGFFTDIAITYCQFKGALNTAFVHGPIGIFLLGRTKLNSRKQKLGVFVGDPVTPQQ